VIRVALGELAPILRLGLETALDQPEIAVVAVDLSTPDLAAASRGGAVDAVVLPHAPEVVALASRLRATNPSLGVAVLVPASSPDVALPQSIADIGPSITTASTPPEVGAAVRLAVVGRELFLPTCESPDPHLNASRESLTRREAEVLALIAKGLSTARIACALEISENTVASHTKRVFAKLRVTDRRELRRILPRPKGRMSHSC
jgi:DNA-binding NarL/FixJ family response regulator